MEHNVSRMGFFDELKGILLFCVVWVHVMSHILTRFPDDSLVQMIELIRSQLDFVVTLFFVLTGLFFKETEMKACIKKGLKTIMRPYVIVMIFSVLGTTGYSIWAGEKEKIVSRFLGQLLGFVLGVNTSIFIGDFEIMHIGAAWFLITLFLSRIILNAVFCWSKDERKRTTAIGILVIIGMCLTIFPYSLYCITQAFIATGYMYIGYLLNQKDFFVKRQGKLFWVVCFCIIVITFIWGGAKMAINKWPLGLLDFFGTICVSLCILKLYCRFHRDENWFTEKIAYIGRCSFWGICVHTVEMRVAWWFLIKGVIIKIFPMMDHVWVDMIMQYVIDLTIVLLGIMIIDHIVKKVKRHKAQKRRRAIA